MEILVRRVEPAGVPAHRDQTGLALPGHDGFRVRKAVGKRDLDLDMLSRLQALDRLGGLALFRRRKDDRLYPAERQALAKFRSGVGTSIFEGPSLGLIPCPAQQAAPFHR